MEIWACSDLTLPQALAGNLRITASDKSAAIKPRLKEGAAIVDISGPLTKYGLIDPLYGSFGTAYFALTRQLDALAADDSVSHVLLRIESPGGHTVGVQTVAAAVARLSAIKPTVAWIDDLGASAAYWLAVNCRKIIATPGALVGSVGTYMALVNVSEALQRAGVTFHVFASGEMKAAGDPRIPLTEPQQKYLELHIREVNSPFLEAVKSRRKLSPKQLEFVGDGRVMTTSLAELCGLIDGVGGEADALKSIGYGHPAMENYMSLPYMDRLAFCQAGKTPKGATADSGTWGDTPPAQRAAVLALSSIPEFKV